MTQVYMQHWILLKNHYILKRIWNITSLILNYRQPKMDIIFHQHNQVSKTYMGIISDKGIKITDYVKSVRRTVCYHLKNTCNLISLFQEVLPLSWKDATHI